MQLGYATTTQRPFKINSLEALNYFFSSIHTVWTLWRCFIMNSNIHLRKNSLNNYFKTTSHYFLVHSLSGFIRAARWTYSSSLLLSLKFRLPFCRCLSDSPQQGFPAPCRIRQCCVCSLLLFEQKYLAIRQRTCSKQRMKNLVGG